jgi:hypothetical protein
MLFGIRSSSAGELWHSCRTQARCDQLASWPHIERLAARAPHGWTSATHPPGLSGELRSGTRGQRPSTCRCRRAWGCIIIEHHAQPAQPTLPRSGWLQAAACWLLHLGPACTSPLSVGPLRACGRTCPPHPTPPCGPHLPYSPLSLRPCHTARPRCLVTWPRRGAGPFRKRQWQGNWQWQWLLLAAWPQHSLTRTSPCMLSHTHPSTNLYVPGRQQDIPFHHGTLPCKLDQRWQSTCSTVGFCLHQTTPRLRIRYIHGAPQHSSADDRSQIDQRHAIATALLSAHRGVVAPKGQTCRLWERCLLPFAEGMPQLHTAILGPCMQVSFGARATRVAHVGYCLNMYTSGPCKDFSAALYFYYRTSD